MQRGTNKRIPFHYRDGLCILGFCSMLMKRIGVGECDISDATDGDLRRNKHYDELVLVREV
jgi:hypothetical protein